MKLDGRNHVTYECDKSTKRSVPGGTAYKIIGRSGIEAMVLDRGSCTKEMEHMILNALNGISEWSGKDISDLLYSHGRFKGYVYYAYDEPEPVEPVIDGPPALDPNPNPGKKFDPWNGSNLPDTPAGLVLVLYFVAVAIILGAICGLYVYPAMRSSASLAGYGEIMETFTGHGVIPIACGLILMIAATIRFRENSVAFFVLLPLGFLLGSIGEMLLVKLGVFLFALAYNLILAILPTVIICVIIIGVIRSLLTNIFK